MAGLHSFASHSAPLLIETPILIAFSHACVLVRLLLSVADPPPQPTKGKGREGVWVGRWALRPTEGKAKGRERGGEREG